MLPKTNKKTKSKILFIFLLLIILSFSVGKVEAGNSGNSSDYAWMDMAGLVSIAGDNASLYYGVVVGDDTLTGYAWSEKLGWINFNDDGDLYGVINDGNGNLSGHAWSDKGGYISFLDESGNDYYQVVVDKAGDFSGYAWSDKLGYISFSEGIFYNVVKSVIPDSLVGDVSDYAWGEQTEYISFTDSTDNNYYQVAVDASGMFSGYAWSVRLGWINFNDDGALYGVQEDADGNLSGYAWGEKAGWISFSDGSGNGYYQVIINEAGSFSGYAWSEKLGWINFDEEVLYEATTTWRPAVLEITNYIDATEVSSSAARLNVNLAGDGYATTTVYIYWGTTDGGIATSTWENEVNLGEKEVGLYYTDIENLTSATFLYYRAYAENTEGETDWANRTTKFSVLNDSSPIILKNGIILKEGVILR